MDIHLYFKKYEQDDFPEYRNLVEDDDVMKYITGKGMSSVQAQEKFASILRINRLSRPLGYFQVRDTASNTIIGECKLVQYEKDPSVFEIGYLVKKSFWGKGLGTMICRHMLQLATSIDPDKDVVGIIDPDNTASKRLLEKFGFKSFFVGMEDNILTEKLILKREG